MKKPNIQAPSGRLEDCSAEIPVLPAREYLDLTSRERDESSVQLLREILTTSRKIVVVAGAGISVAAGIPDFRGSKGMFAAMKAKGRAGKTMFDSSVYRSSETILEFHEMTCNLYEASQKTKPTPFHNLLESLAKSDRLLRLYTQNVDFLDTRNEVLKTVVPIPAVAPWPKVIAVHGSLQKMTCTKCQVVKDFDPQLFRLWGDDTPECDDCRRDDEARIAAGRRRLGVGFVRPRMVLYGEPGYDALSIGSCMAADLRSRPDALIVVGTTLKIPGTRTMVKEMSKAIGNRGHVIWLNVDDAPSGEFDDVWDFVIKGDCQEVAALMRDVPIPHKDQSFNSFVIEEPIISASQQTVQDVEPPRNWWSVVVGADYNVNGMLTPPTTNPTNSDDDKSLITRSSDIKSYLKTARTSETVVPLAIDPANFYAPLKGQKKTSLKRKRSRTESKASETRAKVSSRKPKSAPKVPQKRAHERKPTVKVSNVIKIKLSPRAVRRIASLDLAGTKAKLPSKLQQVEPASDLTAVTGAASPARSDSTAIDSAQVTGRLPELISGEEVALASETPCIYATERAKRPPSVAALERNTLDSEMGALDDGSLMQSEAKSPVDRTDEVATTTSPGLSEVKRKNKWAGMQPTRKSVRLSIA